MHRRVQEYGARYRTPQISCGEMGHDGAHLHHQLAYLQEEPRSDEV